MNNSPNNNRGTYVSHLTDTSLDCALSLLLSMMTFMARVHELKEQVLEIQQEIGKMIDDLLLPTADDSTSTDSFRIVNDEYQPDSQPVRCHYSTFTLQELFARSEYMEQKFQRLLNLAPSRIEALHGATNSLVCCTYLI